MVLRNGSQGNHDIREVVWINHSIQHQLTDGLFALFIAGRKKTSTYSYVFLGGGMPTVSPWRIRTKPLLKHYNLHLLLGRPGGKIPTLQDLFHLYILKARRFGWANILLHIQSEQSSLLYYILNQSTALGCKSEHSWHHCSKSGVTMCRSISLNTPQSWQGGKVKNNIYTKKSPLEFFSVLINVKTPLRSEKKNLPLLLSLQHPCKFLWQHLGFLLLPVFLSSQFVRIACSSIRQFIEIKNKLHTATQTDTWNCLCHHVN